MRRFVHAVALLAVVALAPPAGAQPGGVAEPDRGTRALGDVEPDPGKPAPETDVGERPTRPTTPDPGDATRHEPDTHGDAMPPTRGTGPTHPPGPGGTKTKDAP